MAVQRPDPCSERAGCILLPEAVPEILDDRLPGGKDEIPRGDAVLIDLPVINEIMVLVPHSEHPVWTERQVGERKRAVLSRLCDVIRFDPGWIQRIREEVRKTVGEYQHPFWFLVEDPPVDESSVDGIPRGKRERK